MSHILNIELKGQDLFTLQFELLDNPFAKAWLEKWHYNTYELDDPIRFYGFNTPQKENLRAEEYIKQCIEIINNFEPIIEKEFISINDQDTLNYLHNIFERYHGLLDHQDHEFWNRAPVEVRRALAELNIAVHRCETVSRNQSQRPRLVCTWFGLPKQETLLPADMKQYGTLIPTFGTICLNYVEIGKTLADLTTDNDKYIADEAFRPFNFYSLDFVVRFYEFTPEEIRVKLTEMKKYFDSQQEFFNRQGYAEFNDPRLLPLFFPVAKLIETMPREQLIKEIKKRQYVSKVYIE